MIPAVLDRAAVALVVVWFCLLFVLQDGLWPASTVLTILALAICACALPRAMAGGIRGIAWSSVAPYVAYAACVALAWAVHADDRSTEEMRRQLLFVALAGGMALAIPSRWLPLIVGLVLAWLVLTIMQILGPHSVIDYSGRPLHYRTLAQWSGYPEIGLLATMGAGALAVVAFVARAIPLRVAAALLAAGFATATAYLGSRSAVLTTAVLLFYGLVFVAIRFRSRVLLAALLVLLAGGSVAAIWLARTDSRFSWAAIQAATTTNEVSSRSEGWRVAVAMMRDHPFVGVGPGRYGLAYRTYSTRADTAHAYNLFLHVGAELGLLGLGSFVVLVGRALWLTACAAGRDAHGIAALVVHCLLVAFIVRSLGEHFLANLPSSFRLLLLFASLIGLAEAAARRARLRATGADSPLRTRTAPAR